LDVYLSESRCVEDPCALAHGQAFARNGRLHVLAVSRIEPGSFPLPDILETCAGGEMPVVDGGETRRIEEFAAVAPAHRGKGDRRVWRPERGGPYPRYLLVECLGQYGEAIDVRGLSLVRTEPRQRESLHVLDRYESFPGGEFDVCHRGVVLQVDELLCFPRNPPGWRNPPQCRWGCRLRFVGRRDVILVQQVEAAGTGGVAAGGASLRQGLA